MKSATQKTYLEHSQQYSVHLEQHKEPSKEVVVGTAEADEKAA